MTKDTKARVFIDGEAGTTGLQIRDRLAGMSDIEVVSIDSAKRKDDQTRAQLMGEVDAVILCLPDDAARQAVALADSLGENAPKIIDASTAHRVADGWTYGFAELEPGHAEKIAASTRVANPGCYPTAAIALVRPLIARGIIPPDFALTVHAVSGYSGGGRAMIEAHENENGGAPNFELYGLALDHKHIPELMAYGGLTRRPLFVPSVGHFRQGMLVSVPVHLDMLVEGQSAASIADSYRAHYAGCADIITVHEGDAESIKRIEPEALNNTDQLEIFVFSAPDIQQALLVARLDNLGKGAAGAAVQNLRLMLGLN